ncbi:TIGR04211 family SH3 domain-containing protein [Halotalea alkalilenta]|uniref:Peptide-binding protein n=1 Tax=Halotalea alkalilenta TaxID=376489 RepID=A0A172YGP4_9GAMM|nr:TIGR04211 family SH3 domain-containing protein [Halotalea alkalilenta]ANF58460.1 peptide-binding protein [Halotalea alkalilenta]
MSTIRDTRPLHAMRGLGGLLLAPALCAGLILSPAHAQQAPADESQRWVSDQLTTFVRSGPTDGYRIVGALRAGQRVELVATQGDYSQVRGANGDTVWIRSDELQDQPGPAERVPELEQRANELSEQLASINQTWEARVEGMTETLEARRARIDELEASRSQLDRELTSVQSEVRELKAQLGDERQQVLMRYFVYGGGVAGAGLLAGLILPALTGGRKKRRDRWF